MNADDPWAWLVRPAPAYEGVVFWENLLVVGWGEIPDLSVLASKEELRALHREYYGGEPDADEAVTRCTRSPS